MKKLGQFMDETWRTSAFSLVWCAPIAAIMVRGDQDDLTGLRLLFFACLGLGIFLGVNGKLIRDWIKVNLALLACILCTSSTSAAPVVDDGQTIARGSAPTIQLATTPVMAAVYITVTLTGVTVVYYWVYRPCMRWLNSTNGIRARQRALEEASQSYHGGTCLADVPDAHLVVLHYDSGTLSAAAADPIPADPPPYGQRYWLAGEPALPEESRISFDFDTVRVAPADNRFVVERSTDLITWEPVITMEQPSEEFYLEDAFSEQAMFYRIQ